MLQDRIHDGRFLRIPIAGDIAARLANESGIGDLPQIPQQALAEPARRQVLLLDVADELRGELRIEQQRPSPQRIEEIAEENGAGAIAAVPGFVLERVVEHEALALLPTSCLRPDPDGATGRHVQAQMQAEHVAGISLVAAMRHDVRARGQAGKAGHHQAGNLPHQLFSLRTTGASLGLPLAERVEAEGFPSAIAVQRMLRPVDELVAIERIELRSNDAPALLQYRREREPCRVVVHRSPPRLLHIPTSCAAASWADARRGTAAAMNR